MALLRCSADHRVVPRQDPDALDFVLQLAHVPGPRCRRSFSAVSGCKPFARRDARRVASGSSRSADRGLRLARAGAACVGPPRA